ncbi:MAG: hypothetical protein ACLGHL_05955 [Actinomycetota bacterium]
MDSIRDHRGGPIVIDLEKLEKQAEDLYLTRFVDSVRRARGENGRFLVLRAGDELAIQAAGDGSADVLSIVIGELT